MALHSRLCALSFNARVILTQFSLGVWTGYGRSSIHVADRPQGHEGRLSNISSLNGIRASCTNQDLASKKCVPCNSKDLRPMTEKTANILIQRVPGWNLVNKDGSWKLHRSWKVKTFAKGMEFLRLVADVAKLKVITQIFILSGGTT